MNKTVLSTTLLTLLYATVHAADSMPPSPTNVKSNTPTTTPAPTTPSNATPSPAVQPQAPQPIDCKYRIPAETTTLEQSLISTWAGKAAAQSFNFNPTNIDAELAELKLCYTDAGWQSFNDALQKSGNINAIKGQHLTVSSQVDGELKINPVKDNQWRVTVPLQVVYQNDKEKLTQVLDVDLLVGRKISGDLGIMQMIATPRQAVAQQPVPAATSAAPVAGEGNKAAH